MLANQNREISKLKNILRDLNASIVSLTETINSLQSSTKSVKQSSTTEQEASDTTKVVSTSRKASIQDSFLQDHKFNVVIYGIDECNKGTPRHERSDHDLSSITQIITKADDINPLSICDHF